MSQAVHLVRVRARVRVRVRACHRESTLYLRAIGGGVGRRTKHLTLNTLYDPAIDGGVGRAMHSIEVVRLANSGMPYSPVTAHSDAR